MPPVSDKHLEERILKAAQRLWRTRGDSGLTLRAVAREAGTTTPTLYKRFRNKEALRFALAYRVREELFAHLFSCASLEEIYREYLRFAEENPHEYELLRVSWGRFFSPGNPRPGRVLVLMKMAERFGGQPEDYARAFQALFLACHGTATLLTVMDEPEMRKVLREESIKICDNILENVAHFREQSSPARR
ncbi:MAG TPA: TetR/AcrR family transcriptional regulator [Terriglobales bacterium]|nr:TetR/AcrR family transcriptional regulator [Terriglobales bacterium]